VFRKDFQKLAEDRLADARVLFKARRFDVAYYLAGYAVECAIKAHIAKQGRHHQFPATPETVRDIYSHDFNKLLRVAGLAPMVEAAKKADVKLKRYWDGAVKDWTEKSRYDRSSRREGKKRAQDIIDAIADPDHGVLKCLKTDW
jgi:HEPN domain-containing protein